MTGHVQRCGRWPMTTHAVRAVGIANQRIAGRNVNGTNSRSACGG